MAVDAKLPFDTA